MIITISEKRKEEKLIVMSKWYDVEEIVRDIREKENNRELNNWDRYIRYMIEYMKRANNIDELKKIKRGFQMSYHSDKGEGYEGRDNKFKEIEDIYEIAEERLKSKRLREENKIEDINEYMESFIRGIKEGKERGENIDIERLKEIKRDSKKSLRFAILLMENGLIEDPLRLYPGMLNAIGKDRESRTELIKYIDRKGIKIDNKLREWFNR